MASSRPPPTTTPQASHHKLNISTILILCNLIIATTVTAQQQAQFPNLSFNRDSQHRNDQLQQLQPPIHRQQQQQQQQHQQLGFQMNPYTRATHELLLELRQQMLSRSIKFDEHFRSLLTTSKISLHNMFVETYGMMYEHNTEIFTTMFDGLEQYYATGKINLAKSMENFFEHLYQKIFQVFNSNRSFAPSYLECATEQLAHLKPFKDVPEKLNDGIRHAFVAARTFVQALNNGIDVIKNIISMGQPAKCTSLIGEKLLKPLDGISVINQQANSVKPCLNYCEQVISKCIGKNNLDQLNDKWRGYVMILNELAMKLSTNYNIETIIAPLDVQISEAIMNFQENGTNISQSVFQVCGRANEQVTTLKPSIMRTLHKRAAQPGLAGLVGNYKGNQRHNLQSLNAPHHQLLSGLTLGSHLRAAAKEGPAPIPTDLTPIGQESPLLIDEIRNYMLSTKNFWSSLPNAVCTSNHTLGANASSGSGKKSLSCHSESLGLSDINSDLRYRNEILQQVNKLETMHIKIDQALAGHEINWSADSDSNNQRPQPTMMNGNGRFQIATTTTTTTTSSPDLSDELDDTDDDNDDNIEEGSGSSTTTEDPLDDIDPSELITEETEIDDPHNDPDVTESDDLPSSPTPDKIPQPNPDIHENIIQEGTLQPPLDDNNIAPLNQIGVQKSSHALSRIVINNESYLLLSVFTSVSLLIVTNFQLNHLHSYNTKSQLSHITTILR